MGGGFDDGEVISFAAVVLLSQRRENAYDCDLTDSLQHDRTDGVLSRGHHAPADGVRDGRSGWGGTRVAAQGIGLRTNMLICMGAALFTILSVVIAGM